MIQFKISKKDKIGMNESLVSVLLLLVLFCVSLNTFSAPENFRSAKKTLRHIYANDLQTSFYCGCSFSSQQVNGKNKLIVDHKSCNYTPRKNAKRASRIEWEHVVSAWEFGHQLQCWQEGGRKACKKDKQFKRMEADLHNLVPAIGEVNGDRSNYKFTVLEGEKLVYGACDMEVDFKKRSVEPPEAVRGDIARTYFYMAEKYGLKISKKQRKLFEAWDKADPVSEYECRRHKPKSKKQGWSNRYITESCLL